MKNYYKKILFLIFFIVILSIVGMRIFYNDTFGNNFKNYKIVAGDNLHQDGFIIFSYPYDYSHIAILSESANFVDLIAISGIGEWVFPTQRELKVFKVRVNLNTHGITQNEIFKIEGYRPTGITVSQKNEIYFSYVDYVKKNEDFKGGKGSLKVIKLTNIFQDNVISEIVFQTPWVDKTLIVQTGGAIAIDPYSNLYLSVGDFDQFENPDFVENSNFLSKYLILNKNTMKFDIFARGTRNSQGLFYSHLFDAMLFTEHGPYGGDEVNILSNKTHYGWPFTSFGVWYPEQEHIETTWTTNHEGYEKPIFQFSPSIGIKGISQFGITASEFHHHPNAFLITSSKGLYMSNSDINNLEFNRVFDGGRDIVVTKSGVIFQTQTQSNIKDHISGGGSFAIIRNPNKLPPQINLH